MNSGRIGLDWCGGERNEAVKTVYCIGEDPLSQIFHSQRTNLIADMQHEQRTQPDSTSRHWRHNGIPPSSAYRQAVGQELALYCSLVTSKSLETGRP